MVFLDDTGHETLADGHVVYGLGGCCVLAQELNSQVIYPWRRLRRRIAGYPEKTLHAARFGRFASIENKERVARFFKFRRFARIGAALSISTKLPDDTLPFQIVSGAIKNRIIDVARWTNFSSLALIFEDSKRANSLIESQLSDFRVSENGIGIPIECYFMPKSVGHPGLEVADFIGNAIHGQVRSRANNFTGFRKDFAAIFHDVDENLCSFINITDTDKRIG